MTATTTRRLPYDEILRKMEESVEIPKCVECKRPNKSEDPEKYPLCWNCSHTECSVCGRNNVKVNEWNNTVCFGCTTFKKCTDCKKPMKTDNKYSKCYRCNVKETEDKEEKAKMTKYKKCEKCQKNMKADSLYSKCYGCK